MSHGADKVFALVLSCYAGCALLGAWRIFKGRNDEKENRHATQELKHPQR